MPAKAILVAFLLGALCSLAYAVPANARPPRAHRPKDMQCITGPSYWCRNLTTAAGCNAVTHCIQGVWEHLRLPEDNDDICTLCKNMVKEARDQLQSNETQEELKEVFEGSCNLIPLKPVAKGCDKLVDEFIPELVETLASQMNPQMVCSVAGLCNSAEIDRLLAAQGKVVKVPLVKPGSSVSIVKPKAEVKSDCEVCTHSVKKLQKKWDTSDRDDLLHVFLEGCGKMGSYSDGCSAVLLTRFPEIRSLVQTTLKTAPEESCEMMQYCSAGEAEKLQVNVDIVPVGQVGVVPIGDNMTCEFCERMVQHLRDILVANTTETEFQQVLEGLCKQMKTSAKKECLSLVTDYYGMIYNFLVNSLNGKEICSFAGLCPSPGISRPIWPLLPAEVNVEETLAGTDEMEAQVDPIVEITVSSDSANVEVVNPALMQLPIERMTPQLLLNVGGNKQICEFCEYFLHYVQTELAAEKTVEKVKSVVEKACKHLPQTINTQCEDFVEAYGNAFIALVVQEVDPSVICPRLGFCPSQDTSRILVLGSDSSEENVEDKPGCPLCLLAVTQLETIVKDNKTEESVKSALESLCAHLPKSLVAECDSFVEVYSKQLVDALVADFSPQEVCVYINLCSANKSSEETVAGDVFTNEIPQYENEKLEKNVQEDPQCVICEFAMSRIDSMLKDKPSEEQIKAVVHKICDHLPTSVRPQCNKFVDQYADLVISLLAQELDPKEICTELKLCQASGFYSDRVALSVLQQQTRKTVEQCALCEGIVQALDTYLRDPTVQDEIDELLARACQVLPAKQYGKCKNFIKVYGPSIQNIIAQFPGASHLICDKIGVCAKVQAAPNLLGGRKCTWGPGYWCEKEEHAKACGIGTLTHCRERVWMAQSPPQK